MNWSGFLPRPDLESVNISLFLLILLLKEYNFCSYLRVSSLFELLVFSNILWNLASLITIFASDGCFLRSIIMTTHHTSLKKWKINIFLWFPHIASLPSMVLLIISYLDFFTSHFFHNLLLANICLSDVKESSA